MKESPLLTVCLIIVSLITVNAASCDSYSNSFELDLNFLCLQTLQISNPVGDITVLTNGTSQSVVIILSGELNGLGEQFAISQSSTGSASTVNVLGNLTTVSTTGDSSNGGGSATAGGTTEVASKASTLGSNLFNIALGALLSSSLSLDYRTTAVVALGSALLLPYAGAASSSCTGAAHITIIFPEGTTVSQQVISSTQVSLSITSHTAASNCSELSSQCLSSGDDTTINNLFKNGGTGYVLRLCPWANISLTNYISPSFPKQEISTFTYPTGVQRATLTVTGVNQSCAIMANSGNSDGFRIRNIQINGNRPLLGRIANGGGLIEMGGYGNNQVLDHVHLFEPRAWSCVHIAEGSLSCKNATITNNEIGPSGMPNGEWADGISMACMQSIVANNVITDATDGAIVVFGAPGTVVRNNTIRTLTRTLLGGINLVDFAPYSGNYTGTMILDNTISGISALVKTAIACGPHVWVYLYINYGATIRNNLITGDYVGYGIPASGVRSFTILDNLSTAKYTGDGDGCTYLSNAPPLPFVYSATATGTFQSDYVLGVAHFLICIAPGLSSSLTYGTNQLSLKGGDTIQLDGATATFQTNGELVVINTTTNAVLYTSHTSSSQCTATAQCTLSLSGSGLVITSGNQIITSFSTSFTGTYNTSKVTFSNTAPYFYLAFYDDAGNILFTSYYTFGFGFQLFEGEFLRVQGPSNTIFFSMASDANFVATTGSLTGTVVWTTNKSGHTCAGGCNINFQGDGNLVLNANNSAIWASGTNPNGKFLVFSDTAPYLNVTDATGKVLYYAH